MYGFVRTASLVIRKTNDTNQCYHDYVNWWAYCTQQNEQLFLSSRVLFYILSFFTKCFLSLFVGCFRLNHRAGVFYQFSHQHDKVPLLIMPLDTKQCTGYGRNFHSSRPHTAEIHLSNDKCLLLAAASETEICDWLSVLSQCAMMWQDNQLAVVDHYFSPIACGIIVTEKYVVIFQADTLDHKATGKCLATVSLDNIPAIMISDDKQHNDAFCVIVSYTTLCCNDADLHLFASTLHFLVSFDLCFVCCVISGAGLPRGQRRCWRLDFLLPVAEWGQSIYWRHTTSISNSGKPIDE